MTDGFLYNFDDSDLEFEREFPTVKRQWVNSWPTIIISSVKRYITKNSIYRFITKSLRE